VGAAAAKPRPKPPPIVVSDFRFVGFDKDVVGQWRSTKPDGEPDGRFRVTARIAPEQLGGEATEASPQFNVATPWLTLP